MLKFLRSCDKCPYGSYALIFRSEDLIKMQVSEKTNSYSRRQILGIIFLLALTYIILCVFVIVFPYEYYDSDSSAYSSIAQRLAYTPFIEWCAPQWWGHGDNVGLFQDHPPGVLWITALFIRAGVPGPSAALCVNFLYIFLSLYFIHRLVSHFGGSALGWGAVFAYILTPIFLQYLIRANHEHPLNLAVIAGIYAFIRCEESWRYKALFIIALIFAVLIKGMSAFILTLLALIYWIVFLRNTRIFLFLIMANFFTLGTMYLFELWYQQVTDGISFWQNYLYIQGGKAIEAGFNPLRKIYNLIWYLGRALWFPAPLDFLCVLWKEF